MALHGIRGWTIDTRAKPGGTEIVPTIEPVKLFYQVSPVGDG
jgi:hypothetical protein